MIKEKYDEIITQFVDNFNNMCDEERRDYLIRERIINYESGPRTKRYEVQYQMRKRGNTWKIEAVSGTVWPFRRRFPLITLKLVDDRFQTIGLYNGQIKEFSPEELELKLKQYLDKCRTLPQNAFIKS